MKSVLGLLSEMPAYGNLLERIDKQRETSEVAVINAAKPYLIAALYRDLRMPIIVITSKADNANKLKEQIVAWCGSDSNIDLFPSRQAAISKGINRQFQ